MKYKGLKLGLYDREGNEFSIGDNVWFDHQAWWYDLTERGRQPYGSPVAQTLYNGQKGKLVKLYIDEQNNLFILHNLERDPRYCLIVKT